METKLLEEFGLTRNEISLFLTLIKKGTLSPTEIAKETGLNRPYVYYALERLLEKGYISQINIKGKKNFQAVKFDQIINSEEHKLELLKNLSLELEKLKFKSKEEISVEVLKGKFVVKNTFKRVLSEIKSNEELLMVGVDEAKMEDLEPIYLKKLLNYWLENNIKERIIIKKDSKKLEYAKTTKYKFLEQELIGNTARFIYQDTVIDIIYGIPIYAIITKNQNLADTAIKQFEVFWKLAKD